MRLPPAPACVSSTPPAAVKGCSEEMVTIMALLNVPQLFIRSEDVAMSASAAESRRHFFRRSGDHLTLLHV